MKELERLPDGKQFFRREGTRSSPCPSSPTCTRTPHAELAAYPYEL